MIDRTLYRTHSVSLFLLIIMTLLRYYLQIDDENQNTGESKVMSQRIARLNLAFATRLMQSRINSSGGTIKSVYHKHQKT